MRLPLVLVALAAGLIACFLAVTALGEGTLARLNCRMGSWTMLTFLPPPRPPRPSDTWLSGQYCGAGLLMPSSDSQTAVQWPSIGAMPDCGGGGKISFLQP